MLKLSLIFFIYITLSAQISLDSVTKITSDLSDAEKIEFLANQSWKLRSSSPELALEYVNEALKISEETNNQTNLPQLNNYLGVIHRNIGNYELALNYYNIAAELAELGKDSIQIAYALNNIGGIYRLQGFYSLALENMLKALKFFEAKGDKSGTAFCAINIGIIYRYQQNYSQALEYLNYSLKLRKEINYRQGIALTISQIAVIYVETEQYNLAMRKYDEALNIYEEVNDIKGIASVYSGKGNVLYKTGYTSKALKYAQKALAQDKEIKNLDGQIYDLLLLGKIYSETGEHEWSDEYTSHALKLSEETKTRSSEMNALLAMSLIKEKQGDTTNAYKFYKKYTNLKDSMFSDLSAKRIAEKQSSYDVAKKIQENENLKEDIEIQSAQKNYLVVIFFLLLVMAIILYLRIKHVNEIKIKLEKANSTKDKFFNILAHDLKNPFNATLGYTNLLLNEFDQFSNEEKLEMLARIDESTHKNLDLLENLLSWAILQRENIEFVQSRLNVYKLAETTLSHLEHMARAKNITLENQIPKSYDCLADNYMITTVFRNLVTNSLKFTPNGGNVILRAFFSDGYIALSVEDNGVGIEKDELEKLFKLDSKYTSKGTAGENGTGLGLILCKEFVEKNGGQLKVNSEAGKGTSVTFTLPIYTPQKEK